jgi:hypothetical protein
MIEILLGFSLGAGVPLFALRRCLLRRREFAALVTATCTAIRTGQRFVMFDRRLTAREWRELHRSVAVALDDRTSIAHPEHRPPALADLSRRMLER